jgi:NAD(P)-dependent dehydrogenase (short-subunit alcohol dehydrogenase family)
MSGELKGKRALVTGGTRGIGLGIVERFLEEGATVVTLARNPAPQLPSEATLVRADLSTLDGVTHAAEEALSVLGGIDVLVNNAGGTESGARPYINGISSIPDELWVDVLKTHYLAAVRLDRAVLPRMIEQGSGSIVEIVSNSARRPIPPLLHYTAAKAALANYAKGLAMEVAPSGVRVNSVSPGLTKTPSIDGVVGAIAQDTGQDPVEVRKMLVELESAPLPGESAPEDVANVVVFLASDRASRVTGANYLVDAGSLDEV